MARKGGARPGAGRPAGTLNRRSVDVLTEALSSGQSPVEFMLAIMHDENADPKLRVWAAEKSAPYLHPRPAPLERTIEVDLPDTSTIAGIDSALDRIIAAMAAGEISPSEGQSLVSVIETRRKAIETSDLAERIRKLEDALLTSRACAAAG